MQAAAHVNAEQASKRVMYGPTCQSMRGRLQLLRCTRNEGAGGPRAPLSIQLLIIVGWTPYSDANSASVLSPANAVIAAYALSCAPCWLRIDPIVHVPFNRPTLAYPTVRNNVTTADSPFSRGHTEQFITTFIAQPGSATNGLS